MVTSVVCLFVSAAILRMALMRYKLNSRMAYVMQEKRLDTGALASITSAWAAAGITCFGATPNYNCSPASATPPGSCGCTCTPSVATNPPLPVVTTAGSASACQLFIGAANDLMPNQP